MITVASMSDLHKRLAELKEVEIVQLLELRTAVSDLKASISPSALISDTLGKVIEPQSVKSFAIKTGVGIGAGWLVKNLLLSKSNSFITGLAENIVQHLASNLFSSNRDTSLQASKKSISSNN
jgi:hypothetical protein